MKPISYKEFYNSKPTSFKLVQFGKGQKLHIAPNTLNHPYCIMARNKDLETAIKVIEVKSLSEYQGGDLCVACNSMKNQMKLVHSSIQLVGTDIDL